MKLPTESQISPTMGLNLDEKYALKHFLGRSQQDAEKMFFKNPEVCMDDLMHMGSVGFAFYLPCLLPYLRSSESEGHAEIIDSFISIITERIRDDLDSLSSARKGVLEIACYMFDNYPKFCVDADIFGDLRQSLQWIRKQLNEVGNK